MYCVRKNLPILDQFGRKFYRYLNCGCDRNDGKVFPHVLVEYQREKNEFYNLNVIMTNEANNYTDVENNILDRF